MKRKHFLGLKGKFIAVLSMLCIATVAAATIVGIKIYQNSIMKQYNETAYQAAQTVADYFTEAEIARYAELAYQYNKGQAEESEISAATESSRYQELHELIAVLRRNLNANDIVLFTFDIDILENYDAEADEAGEWNPLYYIMDNYYDEEAQYSLGDYGSIYQEFCADLIESYRTGVPSDNLFVVNGRFGYTTSAIYPMVQDGETVAFVSVEIPMAELEENIRSFVIRIVAAALLTAAIILALEILLLVRVMISPIKLVAAEAESFVENNNVISDKLRNIRTKDEIEDLSLAIIQLEIDINDYIKNLTKVTAEKERIGAELNVAKQIQADMLPNIFPAFPEREEFDIYASMTPAKEVGGDFYDFFLIDKDHLALVIADVSGKGVPAALFMVISKTLLKNQALIGQSPKDVLMKVNNQLCENNEAEMFVTVWLGILDLTTGKLVAANAGHEFPAIQRAGGAFELYKDKHGFVLAGMENVKYREYEVQLNRGDTLFVYTDGVAEATDTEDQLFGTDRMIAALNRNGEAQPEQIVGNMLEDIKDFAGEAEQFDDITMLCLKYMGKGE